MNDVARYGSFSEGVPADLVARIYEAAIGPEYLASLAEILVAVADAGTGVVCLVNRGGVKASTYGLPDEASREYLRYYHWVNPWFNRANELGLASGLYRSGELVPDAAFRRTEFFVDFARNFGTVEALGGNFPFDSGQICVIGVHRSDRSKLFGSAHLNRLSQLVPHIRGALRLRERVSAPSSSQLGLAALDALAVGAVVCDGAGRVRFANQAAEDAAASGCGIVLGDARQGVGTLYPGEARRLAVLIRDASAGLPGGGASLSAANGGRCHVLVTPLPPAPDVAKGLVLMTFRAPDADDGLKEPVLRELFDFTAAEASIALALLEGQSLREIGAARQVTENTLRTQLGHVLRKTGTANQRELMRLLGLLPALRRDGGD